MLIVQDDFSLEHSALLSCRQWALAHERAAVKADEATRIAPISHSDTGVSVVRESRVPAQFSPPAGISTSIEVPAPAPAPTMLQPTLAGPLSKPRVIESKSGTQGAVDLMGGPATSRYTRVSDFETLESNSSPFESASLASINDIQELSKVLAPSLPAQPTYVQPVIEVGECCHPD